MANFVPLILGEATLLIGADRTAMSTALAASRLEAEGVFGRIAAAGGAAMLGVGTAAVIGLGLATKAASDLEFAVSAAGAVGQATEAQMRGIRDTAIALSKDSVYGATEIVRGMEEIIKAGISVDDVLNGAAKSTVILAQASGTTLANAADTVAQAMGVWKLQAGDMPELINRLAAASNESRFDVQDLTLAIGMGGAQARVSGIAYQDFLTIIAATAPNFNSGSDAGTSFKTMLMRLTPYTKPAAAEMERLGIITKDGSNRFFDAAGNTRSLAEIIDVLHGATKNLTEEQKILSLRTIFQADAQRMAGAMAAMTGDEFNALSESMKNIDAEEIAVKRLDNTRGALLRLFRTIQGQALDIGGNVLGGADIKDKANAAAPQIRRMAVGFQEGLSGEDNPSQGGDWGPAVNGATEFGRILREEVLPRIHEFSDWITGTVMPALSSFATHDVWPKVQWFGDFLQDDLIPAVKLFGDTIGGPIAGFLADHKELVGAIVILWGAWKLAVMANNAEMIISKGLITAQAFLSFVLTLAQLAAGVRTWTQAQILLNFALAANPIGIVIMAIAALIAIGFLLYKNWDNITEATGRLWEALKQLKDDAIDKFKDAGEWLKEAGRQIVQGLVDGIKSMPSAIGDALEGISGNAMQKFNAFWERESPSKLMYRAGEDIMAGLANGITDGNGRTLTAMRTAMEDLEEQSRLLRIDKAEADLAGASDDQLKAFSDRISLIGKQISLLRDQMTPLEDEEKKQQDAMKRQLAFLDDQIKEEDKLLKEQDAANEKANDERLKKLDAYNDKLGEAWIEGGNLAVEAKKIEIAELDKMWAEEVRQADAYGVKLTDSLRSTWERAKAQSIAANINMLTGLATDVSKNKGTSYMASELFGSGQGIMIGQSAFPITTAFANQPGSREALTNMILNNGAADVVNQLPRALELWDAARTVKVELSSDLQLEGVQ